MDLVQDLERLAPFGPGNPPLTFASRDLYLKSHSKIGRGGEHLKLIVEAADGFSQQVIWWQGAGWPLPEGRFDLAFTVRASSYLGQRALQVVWVDARQIEEPAIEVVSEQIPIEVIDLRQEPHPFPILEQLRSEKNIQVWCEAEAKEKLNGRDRNELEPAETLAIWTTPPGWHELQVALEKVVPDRVYLFGIDPATDLVKPFLKRLVGLIKHTLIVKEGETTLSFLAAATAQPLSTTRLGFAWLTAKGIIEIVEQEDDYLKLREGAGAPLGDLTEITTALSSGLAETAAFRQHFSRADAENLINPQ
jgi:single-stranded-DNA-specific exonuclease